jgi:antitoxin ParD1/3/4
MAVSVNIAYGDDVDEHLAPEELKQYVEAQATAGYSTPSEYVRELIREDQKRRAQQRVEALLLERLNSGAPVVADEEFWSNLKAEALAQLEARRKNRTRRK